MTLTLSLRVLIRILVVLTLGAGISVAVHRHSPVRTATQAVAPPVVAQFNDSPPRASRSEVRLPIKKHHRLVVKKTPTAAVPVVVVATGSVWDRIARCESGGKWDDTEGEFEGGLQFLNSTWLSFGGGRYAAHAYQATRSEQIIIARRVQARQGWNAWPVCSRVAHAQ